MKDINNKTLGYENKGMHLSQKCLILCFLLPITCYLFFLSCSPKAESTADRYVVLSPEIAEILAELGVSDRIVGRTMECDYPAELNSIEVVGNFGQVSLEKIVALNPSIVFTTALEQGEIAEQLSKLQIKTIQFYPKTPQELIEMIRSLGELCEKEDRANEICEYISQELVRLRDDLTITTPSPLHRGEDRDASSLTPYPLPLTPYHLSLTPTIYIEIYGDPIMSADNSSYLGQLLLLAGYENIFPTLARDYCRVSPEEVIKQNPDIIILTYPGVSATDIAMRKGWYVINAVQNNRIYTTEDIDPDLLLRAGVRNIEGVKALKELGVRSESRK